MMSPNVEGQPTPREPLSKRVVLAHLATGVHVGNYLIEKPLGAGGMGQVYLALDERLGRRVALKILPPEDADDEARARFLREAKALARCEHPNVVRVFASGEDGETAWMALEVVDGDPLSALASGQGSGEQGLDEETGVALMAQVARGLAAVHAVGVVHRDVKPENLLVDNDAVVKIVDFGVALLADPGSGGFTTRKGVVVGTPHFMSPEQARGGAVDGRSDAWSLGATLYSLLTARPPFFGSNDEPDLDILARVLRDPIPDVRAFAPSTSQATVNLLLQLLERDADQRLSDMAVVADRLDAIATALSRGDTSVLAAAPIQTPVVRAPETRSDVDVIPLVAPVSIARPRAGVVVVSVLLLGAAVVGGVALGQRFIEPVVTERVVERIVEVPVVVPPPPPPPEPVQLPRAVAPEVLATAVLDAPASEVPRLLGALLARDEEDARAAMALIAASSSAAGDLLIARVEADYRGDLPGVLEAGLFSSSEDRALRVVKMLDARRDDFALKLLKRAAETHADKDVRQAAAIVRDTIFKVVED
ncbi:MAG: serine/threonine-protein kinase [Deltaproteobacteria bacterium]|nr:serine/threonine-protein kinase [Deltaproteobacteria bacterium]